MDAVYKPILRKFRSYLREKFDASQTKRDYVHWKTERYMQKIGAFMVKELNLPTALLDQQCVALMLTLIFPCTIKKPLPNLTGVLDRVCFVKVFRENNNATRTKFFSDPLV